MNTLIMVWTAFNSFSLYKDHRELTEQWIKDRYKIWKKYTLPSILHQKERYVYLIVCNKKSKQIIDSVFGETTKKYKQIRIVYRDEETENLICALNKKYGVIYSVRIDSDDMYSRGAFKYILTKFPVGKRYAYFRKGYGYNVRTGRLYNYDCIGSGPFFVEKFLGDYSIKMTHHNTIKRLGGIDIGGLNFMVCVHAKNSSTRSGTKFFGKEIPGKNKNEIMARFM